MCIEKVDDDVRNIVYASYKTLFIVILLKIFTKYNVLCPFLNQIIYNIELNLVQTYHIFT